MLTSFALCAMLGIATMEGIDSIMRSLGILSMATKPSISAGGS